MPAGAGRDQTQGRTLAQCQFADPGHAQAQRAIGAGADLAGRRQRRVADRAAPIDPDLAALCDDPPRPVDLPF